MLLRLIVSLKAGAINPALLHAAFLPRRRHIRQEVGGNRPPTATFHPTDDPGLGSAEIDLRAASTRWEPSQSAWRFTRTVQQ
jgi:hypothetical protein